MIYDTPEPSLIPPEYPEPEYYCPVCCQPCDLVYISKNEIVGCDGCITVKNIFELEDPW